MPALIKNLITRSLSKKWNTVRGGKNQIGMDQAPVLPKENATEDNNHHQILTKNCDGYGYPLPAPPKIVEDLETPSLYYEKPPEAVVVSDISSDDDSSEDEKDAAEKYGYGDASPDSDDVAPKLPRRLSSRRNSVCQRRCSSISCQQTLTLTEEDDNENLPFHPRRMPRRSSLKGSCPQRAARRRASIGTCAIPAERRMSIEEEIAIGAIEPSQILEVNLPGRRELIKRRRSIQFNEDVNVRNIQPTSKVKGAVKKELWFQNEEYNTIKMKTRALLEKVDSNGTVNGKKYCTRGLEKYMECPQKRASEKYQAWDSVLMEQEMQRKLNIYDDESLGRFYKETSNMSVVKATIRATLDAQEVASFYQKHEQTEPERQGSHDSASSRRVRRASIA